MSLHIQGTMPDIITVRLWLLALGQVALTEHRGQSSNTVLPELVHLKLQPPHVELSEAFHLSATLSPLTFIPRRKARAKPYLQIYASFSINPPRYDRLFDITQGHVEVNERAQVVWYCHRPLRVSLASSPLLRKQSCDQHHPASKLPTTNPTP